MKKKLRLVSNNKSFAYGLNIYKMLWIFFIASFFGVFIETLWCIIKSGNIESRTALILLQFNPIYGIGAVIISASFLKLKEHKFQTIFFGSMLLGGVFEYLCSLFQELVYGSVSWSYSTDVIGIFERTSLVYAIMWGVLGYLWVKFIYPVLSCLIEQIPNSTGLVITYILIVLVVFDVIFSSLAIFRQLDRKKGIEPTNFIERFYDEKFTDEKLKSIYPNMTFVR